MNEHAVRLTHGISTQKLTPPISLSGTSEMAKFRQSGTPLEVYTATGGRSKTDFRPKRTILVKRLRRISLLGTECYVAVQPLDPSLHVPSKPGGAERLPLLLLIKQDCMCAAGLLGFVESKRGLQNPLSGQRAQGQHGSAFYYILGFRHLGKTLRQLFGPRHCYP
jgi:hypothetical protein